MLMSAASSTLFLPEALLRRALTLRQVLSEEFSLRASQRRFFAPWPQVFPAAAQIFEELIGIFL